jgi:hypothetical protein
MLADCENQQRDPLNDDQEDGEVPARYAPAMACTRGSQRRRWRSKDSAQHALIPRLHATMAQRTARQQRHCAFTLYGTVSDNTWYRYCRGHRGVSNAIRQLAAARILVQGEALGAAEHSIARLAHGSSMHAHSRNNCATLPTRQDATGSTARSRIL